MSTTLDAKKVAGAPLSLLVRQMTWEADGVTSFVLTRPDRGPLPEWGPGSHVDVRLPGGVVRQYSLCGDPGNRNAWRIAVLRQPEGRGGSLYMADQVRLGEVLEVVGPRNHFALVPATGYVFVVGGIGIIPLLPMIAAVGAQGLPWVLHDGGRTTSAMAFAEALARHGEAARLLPHDVHRPLDVPAILTAAAPGTAVYCFGPEGLLTAAEEAARVYPGISLHTERFGSAAATARAGALRPGPGGGARPVGPRRAGGGRNRAPTFVPRGDLRILRDSGTCRGRRSPRLDPDRARADRGCVDVSVRVPRPVCRDRPRPVSPRRTHRIRNGESS